MLPTPAARTGRAAVPAGRCTGAHAAGHPVTARRDPNQQFRLLALETLRDLSDQLGAETCLQYVSNFMAMWEQRFTRFTLAVQRRDYDAAMDVVLSIKISSHMAGAERLSALGVTAQQLVSIRDGRGLDELLVPLRTCGGETIAHLNASLDHIAAA